MVVQSSHLFRGMAVVFAENPNGTAQNDPVNGESGFISFLWARRLMDGLDAWKDLCPTYYKGLPYSPKLW